VLGVRARVADPLDPGDRVHPRQELGEGDARLAWQVASIAVDVLAQEGHLADTVCGKPLDLGHQLVGRPAHLAPAGRRPDAVCAGAVAALRDLDPGLERAPAPGWPPAGEVLS